MQALSCASWGTVGCAARATALRALHDDPELLVVVNVWDVISATTVAALPGCRAIATASHSIAAALGYPDGQRIGKLEMVDAVGGHPPAQLTPETPEADLSVGLLTQGGTC